MNDQNILEQPVRSNGDIVTPPVNASPTENNSKNTNNSPQQYLTPDNQVEQINKQQEVYNLTQKEKEVESKRRKFQFVARIGAVFLVILGGLAVSGIIGVDLLNKNKPIYKPEEPEQPYIDPNANRKEDIIFDERVYYKSDFFRLSLKYPQRANLVEKELEGINPQKLEISYDELQDASITEEAAEEDVKPITEENLKRGFIFKTTLLNIQNRDIQQVAETKLAVFKQNCPEYAKFSEIYETEIDGLKSRQFTVDNCGQSYVVSFIPKFSLYYDVQQIYTGDVGYRQKYKSLTDEIMRTVDFYLSDEEIIIEEPYKTFVSDKLRFRLIYPSFITVKDYDMENPVSGQNYSKLLVIGQKTCETCTDHDIMGVFGHAYDKYRNPKDFMTFYKEQIPLLESDYKVATGNTPVYTTTERTIAGKGAFVIEGLSWKGYTYIFLNKDNNSGLIFVIQNKSGEKFERIVEDIFESIEFF